MNTHSSYFWADFRFARRFIGYLTAFSNNYIKQSNCTSRPECIYFTIFPTDSLKQAADDINLAPFSSFMQMKPILSRLKRPLKYCVALRIGIPLRIFSGVILRPQREQSLIFCANIMPYIAPAPCLKRANTGK